MNQTIGEMKSVGKPHVIATSEMSCTNEAVPATCKVEGFRMHCSPLKFMRHVMLRDLFFPHFWVLFFFLFRVLLLRYMPVSRVLRKGGGRAAPSFFLAHHGAILIHLPCQ